MSGSKRPKRRRAAAPALGYGRSGGGRPAAPGRSWKRSRAVGFACLVVLIGLGVVVALVMGPLAWAGDLWHEVAPDWPGGGYGFAVTAGLLFPVALALFGMPLTRANRQGTRARSLPWIALSLPGAASAVLISAVAMQTWRPGRRRGSGVCSSSGEYCWISGRYPYVSLVGLAATLVASVLLLTAYAAHDKRRRASGAVASPAT
ncbi:hypothetical protein ACFVGN_03045 [Streptomyces sp. NPDC057757]|uniref:hypothetical protein n=1 Tax=Streptomyces sp. NPDC057757 TaxID=3346241 RepID=UPI0036A28405